MFTCHACSSFVPALRATCPACGAERSTAARLVGGTLALAGGSVFAMTLSACYGAPYYPERDAGNPGDSGPSCMDLDDDGFCGAQDCDETDASIYEGAVETVGDGVDSDCGGTDGPDV